MMNRSTTTGTDALESHENSAIPIKLQELSDETDEHLPTPESIRDAMRIRTDLDAFSKTEIQLLFSAGYMSASSAFEGERRLNTNVKLATNKMPVSCSGDGWIPFNIQPDSTLARNQITLNNSSVSKSKIWSWKSPICWIGSVLITSTIAQVLAIYLGITGVIPHPDPPTHVHLVRWNERGAARYRPNESLTTSSECRFMESHFTPVLRFDYPEEVKAIKMVSRNIDSGEENVAALSFDKFLESEIDLFPLWSSKQESFFDFGDDCQPSDEARMFHTKFQEYNRQKEENWNHFAVISCKDGKKTTIALRNILHSPGKPKSSFFNVHQKME